MADHDVVAAILESAAARPAQVAIVERRRRTTYGELSAAAYGVARDLREHGVGPGHAVLLAIRPSARAVMAALGTVLAGAVVVVADPGAGQGLADLRRGLVDVRATIADTVVHALTDERAASLVRRIPSLRGLTLPDLRGEGLHHIVSGPRLPGVPAGATHWERLATAGPESARPPDIGADALVVFTSGSTEAPRAVVHTRRTLGAGLLAAIEALELDESVIMHTDQLMIGLPVLAVGGTWSLPSVAAGPKASARQARRARATHAYATPAKLLDLAPLLPTTVRQIATGGAPVLPSAVARLTAIAPRAQIRAVYGLTEALPVAVADAADVLGSPDGATVLGRPVAGTTVTVEHPDAHGRGELLVSGPQLRVRYAGGQPSATVHTGDIGSVAPDGTILLTGRAKNMIIRGQTNIYPDLVDPLIRERLAEVADCALLGRPDPVTGDEEVVLAFVPTGNPRTAISRLSRHWTELADESWRPDRLVAVHEIPRRGRSGSVDRDALRVLVERQL